jgi:hypothetical protein
MAGLVERAVYGTLFLDEIGDLAHGTYPAGIGAAPQQDPVPQRKPSFAGKLAFKSP